MDLEIEEMWVQKKAIGEFKGFIKQMYDGKSHAGKKSVERILFKLYMNGGVHGKTITKTRRTEKVFFDDIEQNREVVNEPEYQSTIGFTAMQNGRARLLRHCRMMQAAGYEVLMCDTDSMVVRATEEQVRAVLGDAISKETHTMDDLGKFEFERSEDGCTEFDTFKCWGLKRYLEIHNGEYRKSAFAGMSDEAQTSMLMDAPLDGTVFAWTQQGARKTEYGKVVGMVPKSACAENVWYEEVKSTEAGAGIKGVKGLRELKELMERDMRGNEIERILHTQGHPGVQREVQPGTERQRKR